MLVTELTNFNVLPSRTDPLYKCKCEEGCWNGTEPVCPISKRTRKKCKYCRYQRCETLGGMVKSWVLSAYKPDAEINQNKRKLNNNEKSAEKRNYSRKLVGRNKEDNELRNFFSSIGWKHERSSLLDSKVTLYGS